MPGLGQRRRIQLPDVQAAPLPEVDSAGHVLLSVPSTLTAYTDNSDRKTGKPPIRSSSTDMVAPHAFDFTCSSVYEIIKEREEEELQVHDEYDFVEQIGHGSSSTVWRAVSRSDPSVTVAIKEYMRSGEGEMECFAEREFHTLNTLNHRNIVKPVNLYLGEKIYLALEYVPGRTLEEIKGPFTEAACRNVMRQLLNALFYLHSNKHICHRDVKPSNIVAVDPGRLEVSLVVLIDFNIAAQFSSTPIGFSQLSRRSSIADTNSSSGMMTPTGTSGYMAPEVLPGEDLSGDVGQSPLTRYLSKHHGFAATSTYNEKIDVWSAGQVLKYLLQDGEGGGIRSDAPGGALELMEAMTASDPISRPTVQQCLVHSWLVETTEYEDAMNAVRRSRREHKSKTTAAQLLLNKRAELEESRAARAACQMQIIRQISSSTTRSPATPGCNGDAFKVKSNEI